MNRSVYVRIGAGKEEVNVDANTTAKDIIRAVGADPETHVLTVNGNAIGKNDRILPLLTEGENDVRVMPKAKVGRLVHVRVGCEIKDVVIDENTTAEDLIRAVGAKPEMSLLLVNGISVYRKDRILPLLKEGEDIRVLPRVLFNFLTGEERLRQEETLLREIGFLPAGKNRFRGLVKAGRKVIEMEVILPSTFPYTRPLIMISDRSFLGKHPCIMLRENGIEVHFHDEDWKPWMHASDLVVQASDFLGMVERRKIRRGIRWADQILLRLLEEQLRLLSQR